MGCRSLRYHSNYVACVHLRYLSKFSSGLLLFHPPMSYEVVEHFACTQRKEGHLQQKHHVTANLDQVLV